MNAVIVVLTAHAVNSASPKPAKRGSYGELGLSGEGAGIARSAWIVVSVAFDRFTCTASASSPTFTDHRSVPHVGSAAVNVIGSARVPPRPSLTTAVTLCAPFAIVNGSLIWNENVLSPPVRSPFDASSKNGCAALPPSDERSATTENPVAGPVDAGVTCTVSVVSPPRSGPAGVARPSALSCDESPQTRAGLALLRGIGVISTKSALLLSVSVQPLPLRTSAVELPSPAAASVSKQFAVPYPTKSTVFPPLGQAPASAAVCATSATFAFVPLMPIVPMASATGRPTCTGTVAPMASCTRK